MYNYRIGGKTGKVQKLEISDDRIVVRTRNTRLLNDALFDPKSKETLEDFEVEQYLPEAEVTVLKVKHNISDKIAHRDLARTQLKTEPELKFAGRSLEDANSGEPVIYTENIFIKFKDSISLDACEAILKTHNLSIKKKVEYAENAYFVSAPEGTGLEIFQLAETLLDLPEVELCHPEVVRERKSKFIHRNQWHLKQTTISSINVNAHANIEPAHAITQGEGVVIAIMDDGVDIDHIEFKQPAKVVGSRDAFLANSNPRHKFQDEGHGTSCAGVACASGINASGVAPKAQLMPIRINTRITLGSQHEADAFAWAATNGADIISCSWGPVDGDLRDPNDPIHFERVEMNDSTRLAIEFAVKKGRNGKGCFICFAAGNGNESVDNDGYASSPLVTAVAACNDTSKRSFYSDFGKAIWCSFPSNDMGFSNPLTNGIYTTDRKGFAGDSPTDYTDSFGGTSSACPGVAGVAALILSANPGLTYVQVREVIRDTCDKIDTANGTYNAQGFSPFYGYGRVNALKAVQLAQQLIVATPSVSVKISAAMPNPIGVDKGNEWVKLKNTSAQAVNLNQWQISNGNVKDILNNVTINAGSEITFTLNKATLGNKKGKIQLLDKAGVLVHEVEYVANQVVAGQEIIF